MRTLSAVAALLAVTVVVAACGASAPEADFTAAPTTGEAPLTVTFTDASQNEPTSWRWDFGDGETSTVQNPSHEYAVAGEYTVTLTAANEEGSDDIIKQGLIVVTPPPNPVCADLQELRATLGKLQELEIGPEAIEQLEEIGSEARATIDRLKADTVGEYADEIAALDNAHDSLVAAISALRESPSEAVDDVVAAISDGFAAIQAVESAVGDACR